MNPLPSIVRQDHLTHYWWYRDSKAEPIALVTRHDQKGEKKKYHQYQLVADEWREGISTPLPIFGIQLLQYHDSKENIFIFEGERCTEAAHHLGLTALTSMMGANQAERADWASLAQYRQHCRYILVPDHDEPGKAYMRSVFEEIKRACPQATVRVCILPLKNKGDDLIDWLRSQPACPEDWDGFKPIDDPADLYLKNAFTELVTTSAIPAEDFFIESSKPTFIGPFAPLQETVFPLKKCPIEEFPEEMRVWMEAYAEQMQVPIDYLAAPLLVYLGTVIGRKRGIRVRRVTDWVEFPNLWGMIIGKPSLMKSPAMKAMQKPLAQLIKIAKQQHESALLQHTGLHDRWKILKKVQEDQFKKTLEKKLREGNAALLASTSELNLEQEPQAPTLKRYRTDDTTIEKLGELLIANPSGILLFRDELSGWLHSFEKQGRENDRPFFLESWSGKEDCHVDRIGRGSLYIPALCISIIGSIQPGPLMRYIHATVKGGSGDDGFMQRFQIMVWPEISGSWQLMKALPIYDLEERIIKIFSFLDSLTFDPEGQPIFLEFDKEAQELFDIWQEMLENRLRGEGMPAYLESHLAKYKKLVPALALIFECTYGAAYGCTPSEIGVKALSAAIAWAEYLESHAEKVYNCGTDRVIRPAQSLLRRIRSDQLQEPFSARDVYHSKHWSGLTSPEEVQEVLTYLCEHNYLMQQLVKTGGKPAIRYWVHPDVFK